MLLLGAAYGVLEEGLMVCSFFNPDWPDLGQLALYGRWLDINWVWTAMLTIYHAVYSFTIPIVLVELAYHERRLESWVSKRMFKAAFVLLASVVLLGFTLFASLSTYWPPFPQYLLAVLTMALFGYAAYRLPAKWGSDGKKLPSRRTQIKRWTRNRLRLFSWIPLLIIAIGASVASFIMRIYV